MLKILGINMLVYSLPKSYGEGFFVGLKRLLSSSIDEEYKKEFTDEITILNINRGKLSSNIIILIELILLTIDLIVSQWSIDTEFAFGYYGKMYLLMIIAMLVYGMAFIRMESLIPLLK